jgi:hypothetical protein
MLIEQLPLIVKEAAAGLAGSNLNILNGADGLSELAAGLVAQGMTILDSVKKGFNGESEPAADVAPGIGRSESPNGDSPDKAG